LGTGDIHDSSDFERNCRLRTRGRRLRAEHAEPYEDGGAIDVSVKDKTDKTNLDAIRQHLGHIAMMFGQGNFDMPMAVHETKSMPGLADLAKMKDKVTYKYADAPTGGRVDIVTTDTAALAAVHAFLKFQIEDHKTGDATAVTKRKPRG
jgi:hypothetical protein